MVCRSKISDNRLHAEQSISPFGSIVISMFGLLKAILASIVEDFAFDSIEPNINKTLDDMRSLTPAINIAQVLEL